MNTAKGKLTQLLTVPAAPSREVTCSLPVKELCTSQEFMTNLFACTVRKALQPEMIPALFLDFFLERPTLQISFPVQRVKTFRYREVEKVILHSLLVASIDTAYSIMHRCAVRQVRHRVLYRIPEFHPGMPLVFLTKEERADVIRPAVSLLSKNNIDIDQPVTNLRPVVMNEHAVRLVELRTTNVTYLFGVQEENRCIRELLGLDRAAPSTMLYPNSQGRDLLQKYSWRHLAE